LIALITGCPPNVTPWAMSAGSQFRPAAPPALDSAAYAAAFNEVKDLGRAGSTTRTEEQTQIARFWNDGLGTAFAFGYWFATSQCVAWSLGTVSYYALPTLGPGFQVSS